MNDIDLRSTANLVTRITSSVTAVSWIPSEMVTGVARWAFDIGVTHYDEPPPDRIEGPEHLDLLQANGRFRFVNELRAWADVLDGRIVDAGYSGRSRINSTSVRIGRKTGLVFQPIPLPDLRAPGHPRRRQRSGPGGHPSRHRGGCRAGVGGGLRRP